MFQTEIIIGIQSIASGFWTGFFKFWATLGYPIWIAALPLLLCLVPHVHPGGVGTLLGLNLGFLCLRRKGLPQDSAAIPQRAARVATALLLFLGLYLLLQALSSWLFEPERAAVHFLRMALIAFLVLWGTTRLSLRLGWYQESQLSLPTP